MKTPQQEDVLRQIIRQLLDSQQLAVLSTQRNGQPYASLMAFAHTDDLATILVTTGSSTRKHTNIEKDPRVSLLFDNRSNEPSDFHDAQALTALGRVEPVSSDDREPMARRYLERHPYLERFLDSPSTVFLKIIVSHYILVDRFQEVTELHLDEKEDLFA